MTSSSFNNGYDSIFQNDKNQIDIDKCTGIVKLVAQVSRHDITADEFITGVYSFFAQIENAFEDMKNSISSVLDEDDDYERAYAELLLLDLDSSYYVFRLAQMQFESFVNREDVVNLRIGMLLLDKAYKKLQAVIISVQNKAQENNLFGSKEAVCAAAYEMTEGKINLEEYRQAAEQLRSIFEAQEKNAEALQAEVINNAKELIDAETEEELNQKAAEVAGMLPALADAYGLVVLSVHSAEHISESMRGMIIDKETEEN